MSVTYEKLVTQRRHEMLKHPLFQEAIPPDPPSEQQPYFDTVIQARVDYFRQQQGLPPAGNVSLT